jgi:serine/threonine protein phosphatase PrpC
MEISTQPCKVLKTWRRDTLLIDISEINRTFQTKKPKLSEVLIKDILVDEERYGISSKKGRYRKEQEDAYQVVTELHNNSFKHAFAIFDGHSGAEASTFASKNLISQISSLDESGIAEAFKHIDDEFCQLNPKKGGTTVGLSIIDNVNLLTANIGDTRIILIRTENYQVLSYDHVASDVNEKIRVEKAGGYITQHHNTNRVCGQLAITRSIGDARFKDYIISTPFYNSTRMTIDDLALVIASDGLFEVIGNEEVVQVVRDKIEFSPCQIAEVLSNEAIDRGSKDNVTVIVVKLKEFYRMASSQTDRNKQKTFKF